MVAGRAAGRYETEFALLENEMPVSDFWDSSMVVTIEMLLGREQAGDPEHLFVYPGGYFPQSRTSAHLCDELSWEPVDRDRLRIQAIALLEIAQGRLPHGERP